MAASATVGVQIGIKVQEVILAKWGQAGSNLYVSVAFVVVLVVVGGYVFYDAWKIAKSGNFDQTSRLAEWLQSIRIPPMIHFKTADITISLWFTIPVGLATGMLAATIAVGGFIGVPGMIYVVGAPGLMSSATELVIAFLMGLGGSVKWALNGMIDIRLTLIILAGSLFGVQLGAIGTTYVKDHLIKVVMGSIMLMVAVSRGMAIPTYLAQLDMLSVSKDTTSFLMQCSFVSMCLALGIGALIILGAMFKGRRSEKLAERLAGEQELQHVEQHV
jgi:hypothetical protein